MAHGPVPNINYSLPGSLCVCKRGERISTRCALEHTFMSATTHALVLKGIARKTMPTHYSRRSRVCLCVPCVYIRKYTIHIMLLPHDVKRCVPGGSSRKVWTFVRVCVRFAGTPNTQARIRASKRIIIHIYTHTYERFNLIHSMHAYVHIMYHIIFCFVCTMMLMRAVLRVEYIKYECLNTHKHKHTSFPLMMIMMTMKTTPRF